MSNLRRLLIFASGWLLGLFFALSWVWVGEGRAAIGTKHGVLFFFLAALTTLFSFISLGALLSQLIDYTLYGLED